MASDLRDELFLIFTQSGERYALHLKQVDEVLEMPRLEFVPRSPSQCLGAIPHHGQVLAVVDAASVLDAPGQGSQSGQDGPRVLSGSLTRLVVLSYGDCTFALQVDRVDRISPLSSKQRAAGGGEEEAAKWLEGVYPEPDGIVNKINTAVLVETIDRIFQAA